MVIPGRRETSGEPYNECPGLFSGESLQATGQKKGTHQEPSSLLEEVELRMHRAQRGWNLQGRAKRVECCTERTLESFRRFPSSLKYRLANACEETAKGLGRSH